MKKFKIKYLRLIEQECEATIYANSKEDIEEYFEFGYKRIENNIENLTLDDWDNLLMDDDYNHSIYRNIRVATEAERLENIAETHKITYDAFTEDRPTLKAVKEL